MNPDGNKKSFTTALLHWHQNENHRSLPWKSETDPYKIWLSEIILQQTRALQGLPYYMRFTETYPSIQQLAAAKDEDVFRIWQGLGYYNRCKNMLATARYISGELNGVFPATYDAIVALKGIGPYTAAAIASFAYGLPCAVVDGNVYRVLSRYFGIDTSYDTTEGKKEFAALATELLHVPDSAAYNQAIMDLGATVCTPRAPLCAECPLQTNCIALRQNMIALLPVKSKRVQVNTRYFHYLLLRNKDLIWIHRRGPKDIWENLHEPFLIETDVPLDVAGVADNDKFRSAGLPTNAVLYAGSSAQRLTHRIIQARFFTLDLADRIYILPPEGRWTAAEELKNIAFPKTVLTFLKKNLYF
ncbi:MAG: A/G-specific adenine glycosylase [Taibaiella sp.]|nr:A/G-specific adenine glycosylase [Taibaiella sp.]